MLLKAFIAELDEHQKMIGRLANVAQVIEAAGELLVKTLSLGGKLLLCGNGGSAADCQHIAAELVVRYAKERKALAAIALTTDTSILTAHANDIGFDSVFSRQVEALGKAGDCLIAVSTSGESQNVIAAVIAAQKYGLSSIALTGRSGGELSQQAQVSVIVPSDVTARIQEAHIFDWALVVWLH
jgi:Phosphoheptose isomerase